MGAYQFLYLYTTSRTVSNFKLLARRPFFPATIRRYSKENYEHHAEEKAPTTAEEFIRVAEEMAEEKEEQDGINSNFESVKGSFEEGKEENFHKKGDDDSDDLLKSDPQSQISS